MKTREPNLVHVPSRGFVVGQTDFAANHCQGPVSKFHDVGCENCPLMQATL